MGWVGHVAYMGEMGNTLKMSFRKLEEKRSLGRPKRKGK
jgi:hypothetical protein